MAGAAPIATVVLVVGASATLGVAQYQGWGAFGEDGQIFAKPLSCKPSIMSIGWSKGAGARSLAETTALIRWSKRANLHGRSYASWHNASDRTIKCKLYWGTSAKCVIRGRPCQQKDHADLKDIIF